MRYCDYQTQKITSAITSWSMCTTTNFQYCCTRTMSMYLKAKHTLSYYDQTQSSCMSAIASITIPNRLNELVFIGNYLFPIHYNDINNMNEHFY